MKIAILTSPGQWFVPHAQKLAQKLKARLFYSHTEISGFEVVFILSYHRLIGGEFLAQNKHNIVIHASALPQGKGWSPLFHQVLEGKNSIPFSLFEANEKADAGAIYLQKSLNLTGLELYEELREKQAAFCLELCEEFLRLYPALTPQEQSGEESFYSRRDPECSELNPDKSLNEQFNLLRICSNDEFPAFFYKNGKKFLVKIYGA